MRLVRLNRTLSNLLSNDLHICLCNNCAQPDRTARVWGFYLPKSRRIRPLIDTLLDHFRDHLAYTYRHFPNSQDNQSFLAAVAAEAAKRQGKFWPMARGLTSLPSVTFPAVSALAIDLSLDHRQFIHDLLDNQLYNLVKADYRDGLNLGVVHTPTLLVNGQLFHGKITLARLLPILQHQAQPGRKAVLGSVDKRSGRIDWGHNGVW
ncbi:DsbA family protein [Larkinella bovis]|uniref:DsbA family protein n=1 Tax=Larkinella bovis TaxID=683041 RepID=A0ABW0I5N5_9BACT